MSHGTWEEQYILPGVTKGAVVIEGFDTVSKMMLLENITMAAIHSSIHHTVSQRGNQT